MAILYNQNVVVHGGQFTGRLVQGLALVAVDIRAQEIADGCDGQELPATTMRFRVDRDCNGKRIVHSSRAPQKPQILAHDRAACPSMWLPRRMCCPMCVRSTRCGTFSWQIRQLTLFGPLFDATLSLVGAVGMQG